MKKKYLLLSAVGLVITLSIQGQITTNELPVSFKKDIPLLERNTKSVKVMPAINMEKIQQEDEEDEANGMPPRFGFPKVRNSLSTAMIENTVLGRHYRGK